MNPHNPEVVPPPGETLCEALLALGMSQAELAERMGRPRKTINEIIKGKAALTPETALQLERVLGIPSAFWNDRDNHYREYQARQQEMARLRAMSGWLDGLPVRDMVKLGWIKAHRDKVRQIQEILDFFGVATPECWTRLWCGPKVAFRKSLAFRNDPGLLAGWLRMGELKARRIACSPYDAARFEQSLGQIRGLTVKPPGVYRKRLERVCARAGVALVFMPEPPRLSISGATRWIANGKALMQISLRYTTDDQFWLTFFHEAGHILLHGKKHIFLESKGGRKAKEDDADAYAFDFLVPPAGLERLLASGPLNREAVKRFAGEMELAPGVLVGLLQHRGILADNQLNGLKRLFKLDPE